MDFGSKIRATSQTNMNSTCRWLLCRTWEGLGCLGWTQWTNRLQHVCFTFEFCSNHRKRSGVAHASHEEHQLCKISSALFCILLQDVFKIFKHLEIFEALLDEILLLAQSASPVDQSSGYHDGFSSNDAAEDASRWCAGD